MKDLNIKRRDFVKGSAVVAGGLAMGMPLTSSAFAKAPKKTIKVAVVGCGGRGTGATSQALQADPDIQIVAMADAFQDRLDKSLNSLKANEELTEDQKKNIKVTEDTSFIGFDAYKKAIDMADVVILATPPGFRPYHLEYALNNNKHVFTEKPLATDAPGFRKLMELVKVADAKKLNVVVGLQRRYQTKYLELMKRVHGGEIGDITSGQVYWNSRGVWVRDRASFEANGKISELEYQMRNWYYFNWLCGDHILEQHIHNIDVMNWVKNDYPVKAQGMGGRGVRNGKDHGEIFDHHYVEFVYADGTVMNSQCRHQPDTWSNVSETVIGTKGRVDFKKGVMEGFDGEAIYKHRGKNDPNPYQVEHDQLFASVRNGGQINNLEYGAKSTMTALLGRFATYSGKEISWEQAINSNVQLMSPEMTWDSKPPIMPNSDGYYPVPTPGVTDVIG
ncbi:MAG: Gfo/Idh/MocA family oxidoreductase [Cyclobacteriaceae bacterium]